MPTARPRPPGAGCPCRGCCRRSANRFAASVADTYLSRRAYLHAAADVDLQSAASMDFEVTTRLVGHTAHSLQYCPLGGRVINCRVPTSICTCSNIYTLIAVIEHVLVHAEVGTYK